MRNNNNRITLTVSDMFPPFRSNETQLPTQPETLSSLEVLKSKEINFNKAFSVY